MKLVLMLITVQGLLGAFDTLYHHEFTEKLPWKESARKELFIHGVRNFFYFVIFISLGWFQWNGTYAYFFGAIFVIELYLTLWDFVVEDKTRKLPSSERVTHTILTLNYGIVLALFFPQWLSWITEPTGFQTVSYGIWSWIATLYAIGVLVWTFRDLVSAARSKTRPLPTLNLNEPDLKLLVTGGSGFIGRRLCQVLINAGHQVTILCRDREKTARQLTGHFTLTESLTALKQDFDVIINLAGEPIASKRWSEKRKAKLVESRLTITKQIVEFIKQSDKKPKLLISGSAIGYYGTSLGQVFTETSAAADDSFPHQLCFEWEKVALQAEQYGVRVATVRTGMVLGYDGGALAELLVPFEFCLGGKLGSGDQWMSWIHIDDYIGLIAHIINQQQIEGPVNGTAPTPVKNSEFTQLLGAVMHRLTLFTIPSKGLQLMMGEVANELLLKGQQVLPQKALDTGYEFQYPTLKNALKQILDK